MSENSSVVICRCSDLDQEEIRALIRKGYRSVDEIKRIARLGMGPCQGRTCIPLVLQEIAKATGEPMASLHPGTYRPTVKGIKLGMIAEALTEEAPVTEEFSKGLAEAEGGERYGE